MNPSPTTVYPFTIANSSKVSISCRYEVKVKDSRGVTVKIKGLEVQDIWPGEIYWSAVSTESPDQAVTITLLDPTKQPSRSEVKDFVISERKPMPGEKGNITFIVTNNSATPARLGSIQIRVYDAHGRLILVTDARGEYGIFDPFESRYFRGGLNRDGNMDIAGIDLSDLDKVTYILRVLDSYP